MGTDALLIFAVTAIVAAVIGGGATFFGRARVLRILLILWVILSVVLFVLAIGSASFDRRVFLLLWLYFALPALIGGAVGAWIVRRVNKGSKL